MESKKLAAEKATESIADGMIIGLGTGSTAYYAIQKIGQRVQEGLAIQAIATSKQSEELAVSLGIPLIAASDIDYIDITIDGADEVDSRWNLIKGGGGALLREKIVASASKQLIIVVDESKVVAELGRFPLPVEIITFGFEITMRKLEKLGCQPILRQAGVKPYVTDNGNYIADCHIGSIPNAEELHSALQLIPGVVDNGLFIGMASQVIVGYMNGTAKQLEK
ncbi:ribose 5-phosphate isomerase A [Paenibacillus endophyticus]|uniref:Ribose-5-phosphate isomerase A n=1 Tax=Paenibacillus endophyticus TaxID=1294268 RepID=A0A7W5C7J6_9BACL|nr:ribose-5-phosphate isomerase RpiA [Paenibacillus endophyticus]MBB3151519.1 ribose 5-phosphate isomerase A [Paenibacillus endophyticus]